MKTRNRRQRFMRAMTSLAIGGSAFQLSGCDPAVRDTLLGGLEATTQGLSTALISAFFLSIDDESGSAGDLTTT